MGDGSQADRTRSKAGDHAGKAGLAEWETKDPKLAVIYYGGLPWWELPVPQESSVESGARVEQVRTSSVSLTPALLKAPSKSLDS